VESASDERQQAGFENCGKQQEDFENDGTAVVAAVVGVDYAGFATGTAIEADTVVGVGIDPEAGKVSVAVAVAVGAVAVDEDEGKKATKAGLAREAVLVTMVVVGIGLLGYYWSKGFLYGVVEVGKRRSEKGCWEEEKKEKRKNCCCCSCCSYCCCEQPFWWDYEVRYDP
jgi:hypothetical protein